MSLAGSPAGSPAGAASACSLISPSHAEPQLLASQTEPQLRPKLHACGRGGAKSGSRGAAAATGLLGTGADFGLGAIGEEQDQHPYAAAQRRARRSADYHAKEARRANPAAVKLDGHEASVRVLPGGSALRRSLSAGAPSGAIASKGALLPAAAPLSIRTLRGQQTRKGQMDPIDEETAQAYAEALAAHARVKSLLHATVQSGGNITLSAEQVDEICRPQVLRAAALAAIQGDQEGINEEMGLAGLVRRERQLAAPGQASSDWTDCPDCEVAPNSGAWFEVTLPRPFAGASQARCLGSALPPHPDWSPGSVAEPCSEPGTGALRLAAPLPDGAALAGRGSPKGRPRRSRRPATAPARRRGPADESVPFDYGIDLRFVPRPATPAAASRAPGVSRPSSAAASLACGRSTPVLSTPSKQRGPSPAKGDTPSRTDILRSDAAWCVPKGARRGCAAAARVAAATRGEAARAAASKRGAAATCAKQRAAWGG